MRSLSEYAYMCIDNEQLMTEGFIDKLANFFGGGLGKVKGGITAFTREVKNLPEKTKQLYKITMHSLTDISDPKEKKAAQALIDRYSSCSTVDDLCIANIDYLNTNDFPKSKFSTELVVLTNDMRKKYTGQLSDEVKEWDAKAALQKLDQDTKNEVLARIKDAAAQGAEQKPAEQSGEGEKTPPVEQDKVEQVVKEDPIKSLADKANVDTQKLSAEVMRMLPDKENWNADKADDIIAGLSSIVCGALSIQDAVGDLNLAKTILANSGVTNPEEFIKAIQKVK